MKKTCVGPDKENAMNRTKQKLAKIVAEKGKSARPEPRRALCSIINLSKAANVENETKIKDWRKDDGSVTIRLNHEIRKIINAKQSVFAPPSCTPITNSPTPRTSRKNRVTLSVPLFTPFRNIRH